LPRRQGQCTLTSHHVRPHSPPVAGFGHEAPLQAGWEASATSPPQPRRLHVLHNAVGSHPQQVLGAVPITLRAEVGSTYPGGRRPDAPRRRPHCQQPSLTLFMASFKRQSPSPYTLVKMRSASARPPWVRLVVVEAAGAVGGAGAAGAAGLTCCVAWATCAVVQRARPALGRVRGHGRVGACIDVQAKGASLPVRPAIANGSPHHASAYLRRLGPDRRAINATAIVPALLARANALRWTISRKRAF